MWKRVVMLVAVGAWVAGAAGQLEESAADSEQASLIQEAEDGPAGAGGAGDESAPADGGARDAEALRVLDAAAAALRQQGALLADLRLTAAEGEFKGFFNTAEGSVRMLLDPSSPAERPVWRVRSWGKGVVPTPGGGDVEYDAVWDGDWIKWVDHQKKEYREGRRGNGAAYLLADETRLAGLTSRVPFDAERKASELRYEGIREHNGESCEVVSAVLTEPMTVTHRWYFSVEDRLPRRFEKYLPNLGGSIFDLSNVRADRAELASEPWTVRAPGDYARNIEPRPAARALRGEAPPAAAPAEITPPWTLKNAAGAEVSTESLRGQVAVLYFWGTWCIPCRKAAPLNVELFKDFGEREGFRMLGLAVRERDPSAAVAFASDKGYAWEQLVEADPVAEAYGVSAYPTWIVLGPGGEVLLRSKPAEGGDFGPVFEEIRAAVGKGLEMRGGEGVGEGGEGGDNW